MNTDALMPWITYMEIDTRHSILHITEKAGSYHMRSENCKQYLSSDGVVVI